MNKYSIILPTYNERENLPIITELIMEQSRQYNIDIELIIVDDNSPDRTYEVALELQKIYKDKI